MGHRLRHFDLRAWRDLSARAQANARDLFGSRPWIRPLTVLCVAFFCGILAYRSSRRQGREDWLADHRPSAKTWRRALQGAGFDPITDPGKTRKAFRSLPEKWGPEGTLWLDDKREWAALMGNPESSETVLFFARKEAQNADVDMKWILLGSKMDALEHLLALEFPEKSPAIRKEASTWNDPREVRY